MEKDKVRMDLTIKISEQSDQERKVGCIIVDSLGTKVVAGFNHFMIGVKKNDARLEGENKNKYIVHAEEMAVNEILRADFDSRKSTAYINWFPCAACFRQLAYAGVVRIVVIEKDMDHDRYKVDFKAVKEMAHDLGIKIDKYDSQV